MVLRWSTYVSLGVLATLGWFGLGASAPPGGPHQAGAQPGGSAEPDCYWTYSVPPQRHCEGTPDEDAPDGDTDSGAQPDCSSMTYGGTIVQCEFRGDEDPEEDPEGDDRAPREAVPAPPGGTTTTRNTPQDGRRPGEPATVDPESAPSRSPPASRPAAAGTGADGTGPVEPRDEAPAAPPEVTPAPTAGRVPTAGPPGGHGVDGAMLAVAIASAVLAGGLLSLLRRTRLGQLLTNVGPTPTGGTS